MENAGCTNTQIPCVFSGKMRLVKYTVVKGHFDLHQHHFGKDEHYYSHWLGLQLEGGTFSLPHLMMRYDDAALSQRRDAAPLRLISWLTFGLPYWLQDLVEALMTDYGNRP